MASVSDLGLFGKLATAPKPWLDQVVIVGGWAHRLYRVHPNAQTLSYPPLVTPDVDVTVSRYLPVEGQDSRERLNAGGFTEEFLGFAFHDSEGIGTRERATARLMLF